MERLIKHSILICFLLLPVRLSASAGIRETVWLQTDRSLYLAGEEVHCRMKILNAATGEVSDMSTTVRIELFNQAGVRHNGKNIRVDHPSTGCTIELPGALPSGWYFLRAYTGFMMNYGSSSYAVLPFRVINPLDPKPVPVLQEPGMEAAKPDFTVKAEVYPGQDAYGLRDHATVRIRLPEGVSFKSGLDPQIRILPEEDSGLPGFPVLTNHQPDPLKDYFPDITPGILQGHVREKGSGKPVPGIWIGLTFTDSNRFDIAETDSSGRFVFDTGDGIMGRDYVLTFTAEPDSTWQILVCPGFDEQSWQPDSLPFGVTTSEHEYLRRLISEFQLRQIYRQANVTDMVTAPSVARRPVFFDPPERVIRTEDFIELANVREVVYEVVPDVNIRRQGDDVSLSVYNKYGFSSTYPGLIMLDGIPITRHKEMLELPPDRISEIEVKNLPYIHGRAVFSSIVNFVSRNRDFAGLRLPATCVTGTLALPAQSKSKPLLDPTQVPAHFPVLDPVLYLGPYRWPNDGNVEFMTNDRPGKYKVEISGIDSRGRMVYGTGRFEVKNVD